MSKRLSTSIDLVIPFRDEAENLGPLLGSLRELERLPEDRCTLVDDASLDRGGELVLEDDFIRLFRLEEFESQGKKDALQAGISKGSNPYILTSDADCIFRPGWLQAMRGELKADTRMLIGAVLVRRERGFLAWLQETEAMVLLWITRFTVRKGIPILCSGANLLFSREDFCAAGGYKDHAQKASGDDVLLLHTLLQSGNGGILCVDASDACVFTRPVKTWHAWFQQRLRWSGKTAHIRETRRLLLSAWLLVQLFLPWLLLPIYWPLGILVPFIEYPLLLKTAIRFRRSFFIGDWFFFRYIYPLCVLLLLPAGLLMKKEWKGRKLRV